LFKLKFQLNMGQTESLKKIRGLRKDIARVKTISRRAHALRRNGEKLMAEAATGKICNPACEQVQGRRKEVVGEVVANRMSKTIVVKVTRKKAHPFYGRVVARNKKFYAHDEKNEAHVGDVVRLEETRPLSKLKRWKLKDIVRKTALVPEIVLEQDAK
jgi:small subunit ribosomal protein S17